MAWPSAISESDRPRRQNRMVSSSLSCPFEAGDHLAHLGMQHPLRELAGLDMRAQRPELAALPLAPIIDTSFAMRRQRKLYGAHGAIGHHEGLFLDPQRLQHRSVAARREVSTTISAPRTQLCFCRDRVTASRRRRRGSWRGANARGSRRNQRDGREDAHSNRRCRALPDMAERLRGLAAPEFRAYRGDGPGAHIGELARIEDGDGRGGRFHIKQEVGDHQAPAPRRGYAPKQSPASLQQKALEPVVSPSIKSM
ncbi:hypothetical protein SAMN05444161_8586 [Rhizobiales bacterium GAS191]|nr:hypothetical protein SAMN05444161_8586 [Rhizobiales bacterium GAS191]